MYISTEKTTSYPIYVHLTMTLGGSFVLMVAGAYCIVGIPFDKIIRRHGLPASHFFFI